MTRNKLGLRRLKKLLLMAVPATAAIEIGEFYLRGELSYELISAMLILPVLDAGRNWAGFDPARAARESDGGD